MFATPGAAGDGDAADDAGVADDARACHYKSGDDNNGGYRNGDNARNAHDNARRDDA